MNLKIIQAGILDSVQDNGRLGYRHLGINPGGCMDQHATSIANSLVGNDFNEAVIEMHFPAAEFLFEEPALIAVAGADFSPTINGKPVPLCHPVLVDANSMLQFKRSISGARAYLAIRGGIKIFPWLSSYSTNLQVSAGGFQGRKLMRYDGLPYQPIENADALLNGNDFLVLSWFATNGHAYLNNDAVLVLPGKEWDQLSGVSKNDFLQNSFTISKQADRMGYQLDGVNLNTEIQNDLVSTAVNAGTIQLLPNGKLIILMADHQVTGGYPRVAHVISTQLPRLAQMSPGEQVQFRLTDQLHAENLFCKQQQDLQQLQNACKLKLDEFFKVQ